MLTSDVQNGTIVSIDISHATNYRKKSLEIFRSGSSFEWAKNLATHFGRFIEISILVLKYLGNFIYSQQTNKIYENIISFDENQ